MKTNRLYLIVLLTVSIVAACAAYSFQDNIYKTLATSAYTYDALMRSVGDMYRQGMIEESERTKIISIGSNFWSAYHAAVQALEQYEISKQHVEKIKVQEALKQMLDYETKLKEAIGET